MEGQLRRQGRWKRLVEVTEIGLEGICGVNVEIYLVEVASKFDFAAVFDDEVLDDDVLQCMRR